MNKIETKTIDLETIPISILFELLFVILPSGDTLLHKCSNNYDGLVNIFERCIQEEIYKNPFPYIGTNISYVRNIAGSTPLDIAIDKKDVRAADLLV